MSKTLKLEDFNYFLPDNNIAEFPITPRDQSKLLYYNNGKIEHLRFHDLPKLVKTGLIVFNDSKVIPARFLLKNKNGARIEILLLYPFQPHSYVDSFAAIKSVIWECQIGNKKKWKKEDILALEADIQGKEEKIILSYENYEKNIIKFSWESENPFEKIVSMLGVTPLPPYIKRRAILEDSNTYQTIYSSIKGSVAAPTAGLHFTPEILEQLQKNGVKLDFVTLHVGAGTFLPIKENEIHNHKIHQEYIVFTKNVLKNIIDHEGNTIAVGTTALRVLESIYWIGIMLLNNSSLNLKKPIVSTPLFGQV